MFTLCFRLRSASALCSVKIANVNKINGKITMEFKKESAQTYLINIIITPSDTGAFRVSQPWIFLWTFWPACFHVSRIGDVVLPKRYGTFDAISARFWRINGLLSTIPRFESAQLFQFLWVGHPLECLCGRYEVNIGTV